MNNLRETAVTLARAAGDVLVKKISSGFAISSKSTRIDLVTDADKAAEVVIVSGLRELYPSHSILAEESGSSGADGEVRWIIDPLDGTVNFAHGLPHWSVLIAAQERKADGSYQTVAGVVLDPLRREEFVAQKGGGATLNGQAIRVSATPELLQCVGATGFGYDRLSNLRDNHAEFCRINFLTQGVRRFGSAGLDLAYVACGRLDFYWEYKLNPWDLAAGELLVREAGGTVTAMQGKPLVLEEGHVVCANPHVHAPLLRGLDSAQGIPANSRQGLTAHLPPEMAQQVKTD